MPAQDLVHYSALLLAVTALGSAATAFEEITSVSPFMKACWRLEITSLLQFIPSYFEWRKNSSEVKSMIIRFWHFSIISGICLALTFCLWCLSLDLTSIAHSLLFSSASPLVIVVSYFFLCKKVTFFEILGVVIGFAGLAICILGSKGSEGSTWYGDLLAFGTAIALALYILTGKRVMSCNIPMWTYLAIANLQAAIWSYIFALIDGDSPIAGIQWIYTKDWVMALYLGVVPGALGNGVFSYLIKYMSELVISVFINFQPVLGSIIGWLYGIQEPPSVYTWIGGTVVTTGNILVAVAGALKNQKEIQIEVDYEDKNYENNNEQSKEIRKRLLSFNMDQV